MNTNFTPGPWKVESDPCAYDTLTTVTGGGSDRVLNLTRELIVEVGGYAGYETAEANAALIAAAPEMYDEIETTIELLQLVIDTYSLPEAVKKGLKERIETGKNTLKKARGEK